MAEHADDVGLGPVIAELTAPGGEYELVDAVIPGPCGVRVPARVYRRGPHTLRELLAGTAAFDDSVFTVYRGERRTYGEFRAQVAALARWLREDAGLAAGDRVGIAMRNLPEWPVAFFAAVAAGMVAVPLNAWWSASEMEWAVRDAGCGAVVADPERAAALAGRGAPLLRVRGDGPPPRGALEWDDALGAGTGVGMPDVAVHPDDDASILYTSGTTGRPKGAVGTHRNHCTNLLNTALSGRAAQVASGAGPVDEPGLLLAYPMFHIAGINGVVGAMLSGSKMATLYRWDPDEARALVRDERLTRCAGVPSTMASLVEHAIAHPREMATLTAVGMGGAPIPPELVTRIGRDLGAGAANGYGLTETTSAVCANSGADYLAHPDSVGRPYPGAELRVDGADAPGEVGELWFRGPNVVRGYWNNPDADAAAFVDGWFRTGDLGYVADGWVHVVDRIKDVVLRGGENVYSAQVEAAIHELPGVLEVAVFGVPDARLGERVAALVRAAPGTARDDAAVRAAVTERVGAFAAPEHVRWAEEPLPRTATGKLRKREMRDGFVAG